MGSGGKKSSEKFVLASQFHLTRAQPFDRYIPPFRLQFNFALFVLLSLLGYAPLGQAQTSVKSYKVPVQFGILDLTEPCPTYYGKPVIELIGSEAAEFSKFIWKKYGIASVRETNRTWSTVVRRHIGSLTSSEVKFRRLQQTLIDQSLDLDGIILLRLTCQKFGVGSRAKIYIDYEIRLFLEIQKEPFATTLTSKPIPYIELGSVAIQTELQHLREFAAKQLLETEKIKTYVATLKKKKDRQLGGRKETISGFSMANARPSFKPKAPASAKGEEISGSRTSLRSPLPAPLRIGILNPEEKCQGYTVSGTDLSPYGTDTIFKAKYEAKQFARFVSVQYGVRLVEDSNSRWKSKSEYLSRSRWSHTSGSHDLRQILADEQLRLDGVVVLDLPCRVTFNFASSVVEIDYNVILFLREREESIPIGLSSRTIIYQQMGEIGIQGELQRLRKLAARQIFESSQVRGYIASLREKRAGRRAGHLPARPEGKRSRSTIPPLVVSPHVPLPQRQSDDLTSQRRSAQKGPSLRERLLTASMLLGEGNEKAARLELQALLEIQPDHERARDLLAQLDTDPVELLGREHFSYTIQPGNSLADIAGKFLGSRDKFYALARYNGLDVPNRIRAGQVINVPGKKPLKPRPPKPESHAVALPKATELITKSNPPRHDEEKKRPSKGDVPEKKPRAISSRSAVEPTTRRSPAVSGKNYPDRQKTKTQRLPPGADNVQNTPLDYEKVNKLLRAGDFREAIEVLKTKLQSTSPDPQGKELLAQAYVGYAREMADRGDVTKARSNLEKATSLAPSNPRLDGEIQRVEMLLNARKYYGMGRAYLHVGKIELAFESFRQTNAVFPDYLDARERMQAIGKKLAERYHKEAMLAFKAQNLDKAIRTWEKVLRFNPNHRYAKLMRIRALDLKRRLRILKE